MGKFNTYKELIEEKEQLQQLLDAQKSLIRADVEEIKAQVKPLSEIRSHITKFTVPDVINLLLTLNSDVIFKKIFQKIVTARSGWVGKVLVPYFLKNYSSSGFVAEQKNKVARWFKWWFRKEFKKREKQADSSAEL